MLHANPGGGYRYLRGMATFSNGVVADPGYEIVYATLGDTLPYREGFPHVEAHLRALGRGRAALCGVELRIPAPLSRAEFDAFNEDYLALMRDWDLPIDGYNPVIRTNVAPVWAAPSRPSLFAVTYTVPTDSTDATFVLSGVGEIGSGGRIVRTGETSSDAMVEKAGFVLDMIELRLDELGANWSAVSAAGLYTARPIDEPLAAVVFGRMGPAAARGTRFFASRPPIDTLEFEMDVRSVRREERIE